MPDLIVASKKLFRLAGCELVTLDVEDVVAVRVKPGD